MSSFRSRRGFSVVEVLVVGVLLGTIMTVCLAALYPSFRNWSMMSERINADEAALFGIVAFERDVEEAAPEHISQPDEQHISFVVAADTQGNTMFSPGGDICWQRVLFYGFDPATGQVTCHAAPVTAPANGKPQYAGFALNPMDVDFSVPPNPHPRVIAHDVSAVTFTPVKIGPDARGQMIYRGITMTLTFDIHGVQKQFTGSGSMVLSAW